jgi:hypothetical protein
MGGEVMGNGDWGIGNGEEGKLAESDPFDYWGRALKASAGEGVQARFYNGTMTTDMESSPRWCEATGLKS